ncbi:MAG: signal peptidase II [Gammaproteobacteria bacterium]
MSRLANNQLTWLWLSGLVLALDLVTKYLAQQWLEPFQPNEVLPFFNFTLVFNRGAAFSFLGDASGWQRWFFIGIGLVAVIVIVFWLRRLSAGEKCTAAALALILGGAVGNLVERLWQGQVTDFLDLYYRDWHWPTFNIADSAISVGIVLFLLDGVLRTRKRASAATLRENNK